jgi:hypothetical protein
MAKFVPKRVKHDPVNVPPLLSGSGHHSFYQTSMPTDHRPVRRSLGEGGSPLPTALPARALSITWNGSCTPDAALPVSSSRVCGATGKILNCHGAPPASARWTPSKAMCRRNAYANGRSQPHPSSHASLAVRAWRRLRKRSRSPRSSPASSSSGSIPMPSGEWSGEKPLRPSFSLLI